jgi:hypothetical protein
VLRRLSSRASDQASGGVLELMVAGGPPALQTRMSSLPKFLTLASTKSWGPRSVDRSTGKAKTSLPDARWMARPVRSSLSWSREQMATRATAHRGDSTLDA